MTRMNSKDARVYISGYDASGTARNIGTVGYKTEAPKDAAYSDAVINTVLGRSQIVCGPINAFLSPAAATDIHELMKGGYGTYNVMVAFGVLGDPAVGNPVFSWTMEQGEYLGEGAGNDFVAANIAFPDASYSGPLAYPLPFGLLVHAKAARTAANTAVGTIDNAAASTKGGIFAYQLFSSDGTCTLSIDDSATNANDAAFAALSGATSGSIDASSSPKSGMVSLGVTATVRRYLRWQLALGTATTATFALSFIRGV